MKTVDILYDMIDNGRQGKNIGINTGIDKLDEYTGGMQKGIYTLIFGLSGSGKTAIALYSYIYRPLKDNPDSKLLIVYYSLEMSAEILLAKILCLYVYETYGKVIPYTSLLSWNTILSDEDYKYICLGKEWLKTIENKFIILDKALSAKSFYHTYKTILEDHGKFQESTDNRRHSYIPDDPELLISCVIDHLGLVRPESGSTKKQEMDTVSSYCVYFRERCKSSFFILQQENRNSASMDRRKADMAESSAEDLKDTGNTYND